MLKLAVFSETGGTPSLPKGVTGSEKGILDIFLWWFELV